jgi:hypothetical protein
MKTNLMTKRVIFVVLLSTIATAAHADDKKIDVKMRATTAVYLTENGDFQELDESTDRSVIDTDDRHLFGHTDLTAQIHYQPHAEVGFDTTLRFDVMWREDQLGRSAGSSGNLGVYTMSMDYTPKMTDGRVMFRLGRQAFQIGGVPNDYMLGGTLDALTAQLDLGKAGKFRVLALDFFGGNGLPETGYRYYRDGRQTTYNLRGETNTLRTGIIYEYDRIKAGQSPVDFRAYYFYATIGGGPIEESGSDITFGGALGNYRDADYQHMAGARTGYSGTFGGMNVRVFGEFARSMGIDRKNPNDRDVVTDGNAYGGGLSIQTAKTTGMGYGLSANWYHFDGANYASDGLEFERGFVGFKGARIGGNTVGRFLGWRPSSHVDAAGVISAPHDQARVSGTEFIHAGLNTRFSAIKLTLDYWLFKDTSSSFLSLADLDSSPRAPFGHTKPEFAAQERFGKDLGQAIDFGMNIAANEVLSVIGGVGVFLPGDYYGIKVDRVAGNQNTALGGTAAFVAGWLGAQVSF